MQRFNPLQASSWKLLLQSRSQALRGFFVPGSRYITNASKPDYVPSMLKTRPNAIKSSGWKSTNIHSSGEVNFTIHRLAPGGGEVPAHHHTAVWDYFMPLSGKATIETRTKDGSHADFEMAPDTFLAMPPEDVHRVVNRSETEEFVFLIAQSPRHKYDFVDAASGEKAGDFDDIAKKAQ